ncbi:MAG: MoaD/ThiS family protein [Gemmatimonadetes bacterium]|nr:MoaD/ThiS family protein [Gemmatimonadota bacterium]
MEVTVLLFAAHRELVGAHDMVVSLPDGATVRTLLVELRGRGGNWADLPLHGAVAVNRKYADGETVLSDGDEVALIPPVAGG